MFFRNQFKLLFLLVYLVYAASPLTGKVDDVLLGALTQGRSFIYIRIGLLEDLLGFVLAQVPGQGRADSSENGFIVKKSRILPGTNACNTLIDIDGSAPSLLSNAPLPERAEISVPFSHGSAFVVSTDLLHGHRSHFSGLAPPVAASIPSFA